MVIRLKAGMFIVMSVDTVYTSFSLMYKFERIPIRTVCMDNHKQKRQVR